MSIYTVPEDWRLQLYNNPTHSLSQMASDDDDLWNICMHELFKDGQNRVEYTRGEEHHWWGKNHTKETREHMSRLRSGKNNPMYGISLSGEKNGMHGKGYLNYKKVRVGETIYNSCKEASEANGIKKSTFSYWLKKGKAHYV